MSIQAFSAKFTGGGARPNQFRIMTSFPAALGLSTKDASEKVQFLAHAATLPGSNIGVAQAAYRGRIVPLSGERDFQPWTISVYNDEDFVVRNAFENWMNSVNDVKDNYGFVNWNDYTSTLIVDQLNRNDNTDGSGFLKRYNMINAWPSNLGDIQLEFSANNQLESFQVTFQYAYWEQETGTSTARPAATQIV